MWTAQCEPRYLDLAWQKVPHLPRELRKKIGTTRELRRSLVAEQSDRECVTVPLHPILLYSRCSVGPVANLFSSNIFG